MCRGARKLKPPIPTRRYGGGATATVHVLAKQCSVVASIVERLHEGESLVPTAGEGLPRCVCGYLRGVWEPPRKNGRTVGSTKRYGRVGIEETGAWVSEPCL